MKTDKVWKGFNIHRYTPELEQLMNNASYIEKLNGHGETVPEEEFRNIIRSLTKKYGPKVTYSNLEKNFQKGWIKDPQLPSLNSAVLLRAIWEYLESKQDESLYKHFDETLNQIGTTCVQGISHRLFMDYIVFFYAT